ncbi:MAG: TonB-dependent receptor, partial [Proteobacteria bacterium]|nr:TonB-dependent receptor [Pseudomonadota bacterium]
MIVKRSIRATAAIAALSIAFAAMPSFAQSEAQSSAGAMVLEEIVVTARKRSENLQDVPASVVAFTELDIDRARIRSARDFVNLTPNVSMVESQNIAFAFVNIRGLSQVRNVDPTVAVVVDGVLQTTSLGFSKDLVDVQQIEVLKGPQGALYGRNATGGAINITTKQPGDEFEGYVRGGVGDGDSYSLTAAVSGPISEDKLLGRLVVSYRDADGWRENPNISEMVDPYEDLSVQGKLLWLISDDVTADLRFSYSDSESRGSGFRVNAANLNNLPGPVAACPLCTDVDTIVPVPGVPAVLSSVIGDPNVYLPPQGNRNGLDDREAWVASAKIDWDTEIGTVTSVTAIDSLDHISIGEQFPYYPDSPVQGLQATFGQNRFHDSFSQEFRITSASDQRLRWIVGAYFAKSELDTMISVNHDIDVDLPLEIQGTDPNIGGNNPTRPWDDSFASATGGPGATPTPNTNPAALSFNFDTFESTATAAFAQVNFDVSDTVELSFALRYDRDEREIRINTLQQYLPVFAFPSQTEGEVRKNDYDSVQPKLTLRWQPTDDMTVYGTLAQGFRSGGFNLSGVKTIVTALTAAGIPGQPQGVEDSWKQEDTSSVEIGLKTSGMGGRLKFDAAAFYTEIDDAFNFVFVAPLVSQVIRNVDKANIKGFETSVAFLANE